MMFRSKQFSKRPRPLFNSYSTYCIFLLALKPPGATLANDGVLPERLALLPHEVVVGPLWQLTYLRDVVVYGPKMEFYDIH